jgi:hypothetical protein
MINRLEGNYSLSGISYGIQMITKEDRSFMLNNSPSQMKSCVLSVSSFQLFGQTAKPVKNETEPFLTYIKENDTIETLRSRLSEMIGESIHVVSKYRLALIIDNIPHFFPIDSKQNVTSENETADLESSGNLNFLWDFFSEKYPGWEGNLHSIRSYPRLFLKDLPLLGIQISGSFNNSTSR